MSKRLKKGPSKRADGKARAGLRPTLDPALSFTTPVLSWSALWVLLSLVAVILIIYSPVRHFDFVQLDDPAYTSENPQVAAGLTWRGVAWAFTTGHAGYWIPLTWLSYMLDVQFFGTGAGPHHVTNVLLHIANALLLFVLLRRMTGMPGRSAFVAALFAAHPLHVESVAWITERKDVLSTLFLFLTLWTYVGYVRRPGLRRYLMVLICFLLGLMAKPMLVTVPFVLLLLDFWPLGRFAPGATEPARPGVGLPLRSQSPGFRLILEKIPLLALAGAASVVTFIAQGQAVSGLEVFPLGLRVENALISYVAYLGKMIWPARLAVLYPFPRSIPGWWVAGAALALAGTSFVVMRTARARPYLPVGWLWYLGTLVPVIGLVQVGLQGMADRFTYVPLIGIYIVVAWGVPDLLARWPYLRYAAPSAAALVVLACILVGINQVQYWKDSVALWTRDAEIALDMDKYQAHITLGKIMRDQGRLDEAMGHFTEAMRLKPAAAEAHYYVGLVLASRGQIDQAMSTFATAVRLKPDYAEAQMGLGASLTTLGRSGEAIDHLTEAVRLKPESPEAHRDLALALAGAGKLDEAISSFAEVVRLKPDSAEAHHQLGVALARRGKMDEAIASLSEAVRLKPDYAEGHSDLGLALDRQGKADEALAHYTEALRLKPGVAEAQNNVGVILAGQGKISESLAYFSEAVRLNPAYEQARLNLGLAFVKNGKINEAIREFTEILRINPGNEVARRALVDLRKNR